MIDRLELMTSLTNIRLDCAAKKLVITPKDIEAVTAANNVRLDLSEPAEYEGTLRALRQTRDELRAGLGINPLASEITATLLKKVAHQKLFLAQQALANEDLVMFIASYDHTVGFGTVMDSVVMAAHEIRGIAEQNTTETLGELGPGISDLNSIGTQTSIYLAARREAIIYAALLKNDPSAFTLIDEWIKKAESEKVDITKEIMLAGAKNAGELYKAAYPLAESL